MASFSLGATPEVLGALAFRVTDQRGIRSIGLHSFGRLSDRRWIVIVVVDRARAIHSGQVTMLPSASSIRPWPRHSGQTFMPPDIGFLRH